MAADPVNQAALDASRLPDLPDAGFATRRQRELSDAIMFLIRGLERDRLLLLEVVINGKLMWRKRFKKAYRVIGADDEFADAVFGYLRLLAGENPEAEKAKLQLALSQQQESSWDKRLRTAMRHAKDSTALQQDILRATLQMRRHRVWSKS
jgi:hypothetical protein